MDLIRRSLDEVHRNPPISIIDNLGHIGNPLKKKQFSTAQHQDQPVRESATDLEYALKLRYIYNGSTATYNSYRREIEPLLQWSWRIEQASAGLNRHRERQLDPL